MSTPSWRDHYLTDIIEAELVLVIHLMAALEAAGILSRATMAQALRAQVVGASGAPPARRPGVSACLENFAELLEQPLAARPGAGWQPRVVDGGRPEAARPSSGAPKEAVPKEAVPKEAAPKVAGPKVPGNGSNAGGWRPRLVGEEEEGPEPA